MLGIDPIDHRAAIEALRRLPLRERVACLAAAVGLCTDAERDALTAELLLCAAHGDERSGGARLPAWLPRPPRLMRRAQTNVDPRAQAVVAVLALWDRIGAPAREAALAVALAHARTGRVIEELLALGTAGAKRGAAALLARAAPAHDPSALIDLLCDTERAVGDEAESALLDLLDRAGRTSAWSPRDAETLLAEAMRRYEEHGRRPVARAALDRLTGRGESRVAAARPGAMPALLAWLHGPQGAGHGAIRSLLRLDPAAAVRGRALELLSCDALAAACLDRLARAAGPEEHEAVLRRSHLVLAPARARRLRMIAPRARRGRGEPGAAATVEWAANAPLPGRAALGVLSVESRRGLSRWLHSLDLAPSDRAHTLGELARDADAIVRHAAVRGGGAALAGGLVGDADPHVARSAAWTWSSAGAGPSAWSPGRAAQDEVVRAAAEASSHAGLRRFTLEEGARRERMSRAGSGALRSPSGPGGPPAEDPRVTLRRLLERGESADSVRFVRACERAGGVDAIAGDLAGLVAAGAGSLDRRGGAPTTDAVLVATAVAALGRSTAPAARAAIARAMEHPDARVRANAAEAWARMNRARHAAGEPDWLGRLVELKDDGHHRVRASVLREWLRHGGARADVVEGLLGMLTGEAQMSRVAALWAVEREARAVLGDPAGSWADGLRPVIEGIASGDGDDGARARASRCLALGAMWSDGGVSAREAARSEGAS